MNRDFGFALKRRSFPIGEGEGGWGLCFTFDFLLHSCPSSNSQTKDFTAGSAISILTRGSLLTGPSLHMRTVITPGWDQNIICVMYNVGRCFKCGWEKIITRQWNGKKNCL